MLVEITKKEYELITKARQVELDYMLRMEKRRNCKHEFIYGGHGHNDDYYECSFCGEVEWR